MKLMRNQKGEVVTAVMVLMMVGMMVFGGMALRHGDRSHKEQGTTVSQSHSEGQQHMHDGHGEKVSQQDKEEVK